MTAPTPVYSYLRFSTKDQLKGSSLARQSEAFADWLAQQIAAGRNLVAAQVNYRDLGQSGYHGANRLKGAFGQLLKAVEDKLIPRGSILLIEDWDRMSRETPVDSFRYFTSIVNAGLTIVTLSNNREYSRAMLEREPDAAGPVLGEMIRAHSESMRKSKLITASYARRRDQAAKEGRPVTTRCPGWLRYDAATKRFLKIDHHVEIVREIFQLSADGHGLELIAKRLNDRSEPLFTRPRADGEPPLGSAMQWGTAYISKILRWRAVLGEFQPCQLVRDERNVRKSVPIGDPISNYYGDPIIDLPLWHRAQDGLDRRVRTIPKSGQKIAYGGGNGRATNLFQRIAVCAGCGAPMNLQAANSGSKSVKQYLRCSRRKLSQSCDRAGYVSYDLIETAVLDSVGIELRDALRLNVAAPETRAIEHEIATLTAAAEKASSQIARILRNHDESDRDAKPVIAGLKADRAIIEASLANLSRKFAATKNKAKPDEAIAALMALRVAAASPDDEIRQDARRKLASGLQAIIESMAVDVVVKSAKIQVYGFTLLIFIVNKKSWQIKIGRQNGFLLSA